MLVIKNKSNAVIEIEGTKLYPGDNTPMNIGYTPHIQNLEKIGAINVSKIEDEEYISNQLQESQIEYPKFSVQDENVEVKNRIDISAIGDSIPIDQPSTDKKPSSSKRNGRRKSTV